MCQMVMNIHFSHATVPHHVPRACMESRRPACMTSRPKKELLQNFWYVLFTSCRTGSQLCLTQVAKTRSMGFKAPGMTSQALLLSRLPIRQQRIASCPKITKLTFIVASHKTSARPSRTTANCLSRHYSLVFSIFPGFCSYMKGSRIITKH